MTVRTTTRFSYAQINTSKTDVKNQGAYGVSSLLPKGASHTESPSKLILRSALRKALYHQTDTHSKSVSFGESLIHDVDHFETFCDYGSFKERMEEIRQEFRLERELRSAILLATFIICLILVLAGFLLSVM